MTNDLIEGLEKDLERLKRFEENLRIRKLLTMKGGDKIVAETDEDRHNAALASLQANVEGQGAHIIHAEHERLQLMRHQAGQLDSVKNLDLNALEDERKATQRKIAELTEVYLQQKEQTSAGAAQMMRRKMGMARGGLPDQLVDNLEREQPDSARDDLEDDEARPANRKKSIRFGTNEKHSFDAERDTPPTRSRSRKGGRSGGSSAGFDDGNLKSALANKGAKDRGSRSRSTGAGLSLRPKSAGPRHRATFDPPKFAASSGDSRLDAFEAKFEKYRTNKRTKEMIEKRA